MDIDRVWGVMSLELVEDISPLVRALVDKPIEAIERDLLSLEQVNCDVIHRFGPGLYIREVHIPAGTFAIGHHQNFEHWNVMLKGRVTVINDNGTASELVAPLVFTGKPGRKVGFIHEDMVWQNIYATTETDIEKLEAIFLTKSLTWEAHKELMDKAAFIARQADRDDYQKMLVEVGIPHEVARAQSENPDDQWPLSTDGYKVILYPSPIEGTGLFATAKIHEGESIAPARILSKRTFAGRYTNHSSQPNAKMVFMADGDVHLIAIRDIQGCKGGNMGEEVTIDYRQALSLTRGQGDIP